MSTINLNVFCQPRYELLSALVRLVDIVDYNMNDSSFFDLRKNIEDMIYPDEAMQIIDFIGYRVGVHDMCLLISELQRGTGIILSLQTVLFIMISPVKHIKEQLNIDEETALWFYTCLHIRFMSNDSVGFIKALLLDVKNRRLNHKYAHSANVAVL